MRVNVHPDPLVEALREQTVEAQLLQALGRSREIRRGPLNPVNFHIYTSVPLRGIAVDEILNWKNDVVVDRGELVLARYGVMPL